MRDKHTPKGVLNEESIMKMRANKTLKGEEKRKRDIKVIQSHSSRFAWGIKKAKPFINRDKKFSNLSQNMSFISKVKKLIRSFLSDRTWSKLKYDYTSRNPKSSKLNLDRTLQVKCFCLNKPTPPPPGAIPPLLFGYF